MLHQEFKQKKEKLKNTSKVSILAKYGGEVYLEKAPKELLQGQTEDYVEYSRTGQVIKGRERVKARSKYPEDGTLLDTLLDLFTNTIQSLSRTTLLFGVRGMIPYLGSGATPVASQRFTYHTALAKLVLKLLELQVQDTSWDNH